MISKKTMIRQAILHDYQSLAKTYDEHWSTFLESTHNWVLAHLENPGHVIDLGCGTGRLLESILHKHPDSKLTGLDISPDMLTIAQQRLPQARLQETDFTTAKIKKKFDTVLSINVLHHLNNPESHIASLHSLCAKNGAIFLCDFAIEPLPLKTAEQYWRFFHPAHHRAFTRKKLRSMLEKHFIIENEALLQPDRFWRLQIYKLQKPQSLDN